MLKKLSIKNIALIESVEIDFSNGLNVLSGETGSGKSVIIESINFVLGCKADKTLIRSGENECFVSALFDVSNNNAIKDVYCEFDFDVEDELIISRKFDLNGKNSIKVNGNTVNVSMLKKFTHSLVDVHGQSEHFELLDVSNQLKLIDKYCGDNALTIKDNIRTIYDRLKEINKSLDALGGDDSYREMRIDVLNYQINEIEKAELKENEEAELLEIKDKLKNQEKILTALNGLKSYISEENGLSDILLSMTKLSSSITDFSNEYKSLDENINISYENIDNILSNIESYIDSFDYSEYNQEDIENRLDLIKSLKRKYGNSFLEINSFYEKAKNERENLINFNKNANELLKEKDSRQKELFELYGKLSSIRKNNAIVLSKNIVNELYELGMNKAQFAINFNETPSFEECKFDSPNGFDNVEFMFSANLGEPLKTLSNVISGGEMSRFMLAIKAQSAKYNDISTYIFDEIDAGISGNIATIVAHKLISISKNVQVIAITHLPQISIYADNNLLISKSEVGNKTLTSVKNLSDNEKIDEIIRLVGGKVDSESAKNHALNLLEEAEQYKKSI